MRSEVGVIVEELTKLLVKAWNASLIRVGSQVGCEVVGEEAKKLKDPDAPKREVCLHLL